MNRSNRNADRIKDHKDRAMIKQFMHVQIVEDLAEETSKALYYMLYAFSAVVLKTENKFADGGQPKLK